MKNPRWYDEVSQAAEMLGVELDWENRLPKPGELYFACRNTGPKLLTCKEIHPKNWIVCEENEYSYDTWECVRIKS